MLRTWFWYTLGWSYLVLTFPLMLIVKYLEKRKKINKRDAIANRISRHLSRVLFRITGSKIEVIGAENIPENQTVLFVANHQSHIDSAIIHGFINVPKGFVSIVEVLKIPIVRTWMKYMRCVFLDRKDMRHTLKTMEQCVNILKQGHSMVIYPEGKLSENETVGEFKKGGLKLAIKADVPIIPVVLKGSHKVMTKSGSRISASTVKCIIAEPVYTDRRNKSEAELIDLVRNIIIDNNIKA